MLRSATVCRLRFLWRRATNRPHDIPEEDDDAEGLVSAPLGEFHRFCDCVEPESRIDAVYRYFYAKEKIKNAYIGSDVKSIIVISCRYRKTRTTDYRNQLHAALTERVLDRVYIHVPCSHERECGKEIK